MRHPHPRGLLPPPVLDAVFQPVPAAPSADWAGSGTASRLSTTGAGVLLLAVAAVAMVAGLPGLRSRADLAVADDRLQDGSAAVAAPAEDRTTSTRALPRQPAPFPSIGLLAAQAPSPTPTTTEPAASGPLGRLVPGATTAPPGTEQRAKPIALVPAPAPSAQAPVLAPAPPNPAPPNPAPSNPAPSNPPPPDPAPSVPPPPDPVPSEPVPSDPAPTDPTPSDPPSPSPSPTDPSPAPSGGVLVPVPSPGPGTGTASPSPTP